MSSDGADDPYVYPSTQTLRNNFDIRDPDRLQEVEVEYSQQRLTEPAPRIDLTPAGYGALHRHVFGDVYPWAGEMRTVHMSKGNDVFCAPQFLPVEMAKCFAALRAGRRLTSRDPERFAEAAAEHINEINARHPFREGNGRVQRLLLDILAERAGYHLAVDRIDPQAWNEASVIGFRTADHAPMRDVLRAALIVARRSRAFGACWALQSRDAPSAERVPERHGRAVMSSAARHLGATPRSLASLGMTRVVTLEQTPAS
jgi:cell filamentation protein